MTDGVWTAFENALRGSRREKMETHQRRVEQFKKLQELLIIKRARANALDAAYAEELESSEDSQLARLGVALRHVREEQRLWHDINMGVCEQAIALNNNICLGDPDDDGAATVEEAAADTEGGTPSSEG